MNLCGRGRVFDTPENSPNPLSIYRDFAKPQPRGLKLSNAILVVLMFQFIHRQAEQYNGHTECADDCPTWTV